MRGRRGFFCLLLSAVVASACCALWGGAGFAAGNGRVVGGGARTYATPSVPFERAVVPPDADGVVNVVDFGAIGDGMTDNTLPIQAALDALGDTGGTVFFPVGRYKVNGQIVLPNDDGSPEVRQPPFVFTGVGAFYDGRKGIPSGGTILDLRHDGPKIATYGLGLFEATGITFASFGGDSEPFIYTTNTTLHIHNCGFYGNKPHHTADNDAIVLGGTDPTAVGTSDPNAPFQGYGTVIRDNYFARTRRMVYGRVFANAVVVTGNTVWSNSGTNLPGGAAIELDGDPDNTTLQVNGGWYVAGNLIEMPHYPYGVKCRESQRNAFIANNFYDRGAVTQAYYRFETTGKLNYVLAGFHDDDRTFVEDSATGIDKSTVIDFHQLRESTFAQSSRFLSEVYLAPTASSASPYGPRLLSQAGTELTYQLSDDSGMILWYTPFLGIPIQLWEISDQGNGTVVQDLKGSEARIRNLNGSVSLLADEGSELELGDTTGAGIKIEEGKVRFSATSVQLLSGSGAPTMSAPDGSLYLRSDGGSGTTLYVRENGAWVAK